MTIDVETVMAASITLSVFAAVAALGTSIVLGVGFERLRAGFEAIAKQTGLFSDMLHKLEKKVEVVDGQTAQASKSVRTLELKVDGITEQTNVFAGSIQQLAEKVECMDSLPAGEQVQEPANPLANIQNYFKSDARNVLVAANKAKETKQKNAVRAKMHAIAKEIDRPSLKEDPIKDLSHWENVEEPARIHYN